MRKPMLIVLIILGAVLCLTGCRPESMRIDVEGLHEGVWLVTMVRVEPGDEDYEDNDPVLPTNDGEIHLSGTMIDTYCEDGWRCAECHLRHGRYIGYPSDVFHPFDYFEGNSGLNRLARRFGSMRVAAIDAQGTILKISNEVSFYAKDRFAVAGSGAYDYEANRLTLRYDVRRELGGFDLMDIGASVYILSIFMAVILLAACVPKNFRAKAGRGAVIVFLALSLPTIAFCVLHIIAWLPYFTPEGVERSTPLELIGGILVLNCLWLIDLSLFVFGKYQANSKRH